MITASLSIRCKENKFGCKWTGVILDYDVRIQLISNITLFYKYSLLNLYSLNFFKDHEKICLYKSLECPLNGCKMKVIKSALNDHMMKCPFRLVKCEYCFGERAFNSLEVCVLHR